MKCNRTFYVSKYSSEHKKSIGLILHPDLVMASLKLCYKSKKLQGHTKEVLKTDTMLPQILIIEKFNWGDIFSRNTEYR